MLLSCAFVCAARPALAKASADAKKAARFEKRAKKAYVRKRWDDAIVAFRLAYEVHPKPKHLYNMARCHEMKGDLVAAIELTQRFLDEEKAPKEREDGEETLAILEGKLRASHARLALTSTPDGALVRGEADAGKLEGKTPLTKWLKAGIWRLSFRAPKHVDEGHELLLEAGKPATLHVELRAAGEPEKPPPAPPEPEAPPEPPAEAPVAETPAAVPEPAAEAASGSSLPLVALGVGGVLLATGAMFGVLSRGAVDDLESSRSGGSTWSELETLHERASSQALAANVLLAGGAVAVGTGLALALLLPSAEASWAPLPGGGLVTLGGAL